MQSQSAACAADWLFLRQNIIPAQYHKYFISLPCDYEKSRNEKIRNMENPFKFGTIVEEEYFTDRVNEVAYIKQFLESANHLVLISPRPSAPE